MAKKLSPVEVKAHLNESKNLPSANYPSQNRFYRFHDPETDLVAFYNPTSKQYFYTSLPPGKKKLPTLEGKYLEINDTLTGSNYYFDTDARITTWKIPTDGFVLPVALFHKIFGCKRKEAATESSKVERKNQQDLSSLNLSGKKFSDPKIYSNSSPVEIPNSEDHLNAKQPNSYENVKQGIRYTMSSSDFSPIEQGSNWQAFGNIQNSTSSNSIISEVLVSTPVNKGYGNNHTSNIRLSRIGSSGAEQIRDRILSLSNKNASTTSLLDEYANKYFAKRHVGIFRRRQIPVEDFLYWKKGDLDRSLLVINKKLQKTALECFRRIQVVMGDTQSKSGLHSPLGHKNTGKTRKSVTNPYMNQSNCIETYPKDTFEDLKFLIDQGVKYVDLRDEIYVQLCKQISRNPSTDSVRRGWNIMCVFVIFFAPSKNFERYLYKFIDGSYKDPTASKDVVIMAKYSMKKLIKISQFGGRGVPPTRIEIERATEAAFTPRKFGESLSQILEDDQKDQPGITVPTILNFLIDQITLKMDGYSAQGIFRLPGNADCVAEARMKLDGGVYDEEGLNFREVHVPAALLKLWLRELDEPLFPGNMYDQCVRNSTDEKKVESLVNQLPLVNKAVVEKLMDVLENFSKPMIVENTKMSIDNLAMVFAPSFLRCPSDNPQVILHNNKFEQSFVKTLITIRLNQNKDK